MKKGKEWLKNEIEIMGSETSENYPHEQMVDREEVLNLIDQLDEPVKVVIPQFVATFIEYSRKNVGNIVTAIWEMYDYEYEDVYEWVLEDGNDEVLMKAFVNGYEVEKEKLYKFSSNNQSAGFWFLSTTLDGKVNIGTNREFFEHDSKCLHITEKQIKDYDERYWSFAVEVAE